MYLFTKLFYNTLNPHAYNTLNNKLNQGLVSLPFNSKKFYSTNEEKDSNNQTNGVNINDSFNNNLKVIPNKSS